MKFSVLIPVYNTEKYLEECLQSVLNQTYKDYEIILVDDGSTDSSPQICDDYQNKYPNTIKVIHQKNSGQLASRLNAITASTGDYFVFADADDLLIDNALQTISDNLVRYDKPDMLVYSFYYESDDGSLRKADRLFPDGIVDSNQLHQMFFTGTGLNNVWTKAVKREIALCDGFDFSKYYSLRCSEDKLHSMAMIDTCSSVAYIYEPLYRYRLFDGSVTRQYIIDSIEKNNTVQLYDEEKCFLIKWNLPLPEWQLRFDAHCANAAFHVFSVFYKNTKGKTRKQIVKYDWTRFLSQETLNNIQGNPYLNETAQELWSWIIEKKHIGLYAYFTNKIIRKRIKRIIEKR